MSYEIKLDKFEGPLDLLLHLIKKNEMDIYDIPIAEITEQYLASIDAMRSLNLDLAGEFLLMASTLLHIKSRLLLPQPDLLDEEDEEDDPRAELVRRLLEYQKYKEAAQSLNDLKQLGRDVFACFSPLPEPEEGEAEFQSIGLFDLVEAIQELLKKAPEESFHEISTEELSITDSVNRILSLVSGKSSLPFPELFSDKPTRAEIVVTFLAMLELVKMKLVRLMQNKRFGMIWLSLSVGEDELNSIDLDEGVLGYH